MVKINGVHRLVLDQDPVQVQEQVVELVHLVAVWLSFLIRVVDLSMQEDWAEVQALEAQWSAELAVKVRKIRSQPQESQPISHSTRQTISRKSENLKECTSNSKSNSKQWTNLEMALSAKKSSSISYLIRWKAKCHLQNRQILGRTMRT